MVRSLCFFVCFFCTLWKPLHTSEPMADTWVIGTTSGYAPFVSLNNKGEYEGFDIDMANLIAAKLDKKLVIQDIGSMAGLLMALQKEKIDTAIWAISITEQRKKEITMIHYQGDTIQDIPFLFWKKVPEGISQIEDLARDAKKIICVEAGSSQHGVMMDYPSISLRPLDKLTDGIMDIKYGKALAIPVDNSLVPHLMMQYPDLRVLYLPLPPHLQTFGFGICLSKTNRELSEQVAKAVVELRAEGKIAELEQKWNLSR